jgi:glycosyltransferase involved in cell wall biosynthesis
VSSAPSIIIPVRDRAGVTRRCLDLLLSQPECSDAEVVVVDDASTDSTSEMLAGYGESIRLVRLEHSGGF